MDFVLRLESYMKSLKAKTVGVGCSQVSSLERTFICQQILAGWKWKYAQDFVVSPIQGAACVTEIA